MNKTWLWNVKTPINEVEKILRDPKQAKFVYFSALLLERNNNPKMVFSKMSREHFLQYWYRIKKQMKKDAWNAERILFWQAIYDFFQKKYKARGITIKKVTAKKKITPEYRKMGEKIRAYRKAIGIKQAEFAKRLGVTQQLVSRMEMGDYQFNLKNLHKIQEVLGLRLWENHEKHEIQQTSGNYVSEPGITFSNQR